MNALLSKGNMYRAAIEWLAKQHRHIRTLRENGEADTPCRLVLKNRESRGQEDRRHITNADTPHNKHEKFTVTIATLRRFLKALMTM